MLKKVTDIKSKKRDFTPIIYLYANLNTKFSLKFANKQIII